MRGATSRRIPKRQSDGVDRIHHYVQLQVRLGIGDRVEPLQRPGVARWLAAPMNLPMVSSLSQTDGAIGAGGALAMRGLTFVGSAGGASTCD